MTDLLCFCYTGCQENEYTCDDGQCISLSESYEEICDGHTHCSDGSDEIYCTRELNLAFYANFL